MQTVSEECLFNHDSYSSSLSLSVWLRLSHVCARAHLPVARQLWLYSPWPAFKDGGWRIVSSHFVLGEVSNGLWKDGSHLSEVGLWRMATCLHCGSDGWRPLCAGAEWDMQLPKRRAVLHTIPPPVAVTHCSFLLPDYIRNMRNTFIQNFNFEIIALDVTAQT